MHFKTLISWESYTKNGYVCSCEYLHDQNDKYVYFKISSLHKKLIPRLNTKYQHEVMKRKIWTWSFTHNPSHTWRKKWIKLSTHSPTFNKHYHSSIIIQYGTYYPSRTIILRINKSLNYLQFFECCWIMVWNFWHAILYVSTTRIVGFTLRC
jgi:hypothetical protein